MNHYSKNNCLGKWRNGLLALCCLVFMALPYLAYAQQAHVTITVTNETLRAVLDRIEKETVYRFTHLDVALPAEKNVSLSVENAPIESVLHQLLAATSLTYRRNGNTFAIIPRPQPEAAMLVKGQVTDAEGTLAGASVKVKGTNKVVVTDVDGRFSLAANAQDVLEVSFVGYSTKEVPIAGRTQFEVTMEEDAQALEEVVVIGYGVISRKNLTTAISSVKMENISKAAVSNMSQMLLGRAAGLRASITSAQPGGDVNLSIRGGGTPIFIVDGIMMPSGSLEVGSGQTQLMSSIHRGGLAGLNPNDIESIEILKDASAAIYGIGASNGVVLITTKEGSEGKPRITFDSNWSVVKNYPYVRPLNAQEYMNMANVFNKENYLFINGMYPYGNKPFDNNWLPTFSPQQIAEAQTTHWLDYVLKTGSMSNQNISITGGSKRLKYYLSGNYYNHEGSVINSGMKRFALRTNISSQLFDFLKLTAIINVNQNNYRNSSAEGGDVWSRELAGALHTALAYPPHLPVQDADGNYTIYQNYPNPAEMSRMNDRTKSNGYYLNFAADVDIIKGMLSMRLMYGVNKENANRVLYIPSDLYFFSMRRSRGHTGYAERQNETFEATISFKKQFGDWLRVDAVAGMGRYLNAANSLDVDYQNANDVIAGDRIEAAEGPFYPASGKAADERRSQFIRTSFDVLDRYVLSATLRRDGTDKFFPNKKYALFPSVSVAWKLSNESFMNDIEWIDLLKIRASYGQTGRDNLGNSLYSVFSPAATYIMFAENTATYIPYSLSGPDYPNVTWEKTVMKDVGLDFSLFKDHIWGSFDWFRNDVTNLLGNANAPFLSMTGTNLMNYGHYYRTGWDATINSLNIEIPNSFKWTSQLTLTRFDGYWVERQQNYIYQEYQIRENEPMNAYYYYETDGMINMDKSNMPESQKSLPVEAQQPGYPIIKDKNGDGQITIDDVYMDNTIPTIGIGFGNTFAYKGFDLDIFLYGQFGAERTNYALSWATAGQLYYPNPRNATEYAYNIWNSQTNPNGTERGVASYRSVAMPGNAGVRANMQNASFVRVRNLTFGYTLEGSKLGNVGNYISRIRVFIDCQNPFTFTKFTGFDPEIFIGNGISLAEYPMTRTFSLGAKINF